MRSRLRGSTQKGRRENYRLSNHRERGPLCFTLTLCRVKRISFLKGIFHLPKLVAWFSKMKLFLSFQIFQAAIEKDSINKGFVHDALACVMKKNLSSRVATGIVIPSLSQHDLLNGQWKKRCSNVSSTPILHIWHWKLVPILKHLLLSMFLVFSLSDN